MKFIAFVDQYQFYQRSISEVMAELVRGWKNKSSKHLVTIATPNPEQLVQAYQDERFGRALSQFDLLLPDGVGLVWLSRIHPRLTEIKQKIAGVEFVSRLLKLAQRRKMRVLVIGGRALAGRRVKLDDQNVYQIVRADQIFVNKHAQHYPAIYWHYGFEDVGAPKPAEQASLLQVVNKLRPDLIFVGLGAPHQEFWIQANRKWLEQRGVRIVMAVGGSFDMLTGLTPRAPRLVRLLQLEWLWRLLLQPWRIKRQLRLIKFVWLSLVG